MAIRSRSALIWAKVVVKKLREPDRAVTDLKAGAIPLSDVNFNEVERYWPVLVITEPLLQSDIFWDYIDRELSKPLFTEARMMPVTLLGLDEFEELMSLVTDGASLIGILEHKTAPTWRRRDLRAWARAQSGAIRDLGQTDRSRRFNVTLDRLLATIGAPKDILDAVRNRSGSSGEAMARDYMT